MPVSPAGATTDECITFVFTYQNVGYIVTAIVSMVAIVLIATFLRLADLVPVGGVTLAHGLAAMFPPDRLTIVVRWRLNQSTQRSVAISTADALGEEPVHHIK